RSGSRPGSKYVRVLRVQRGGFRRVGPGVLQATGVSTAPRGGFNRFMAGLRRRAIGQPLATSELAHERLTKIKALAVFSSDALSSVAYATEEILYILVGAA